MGQRLAAQVIVYPFESDQQDTRLPGTLTATTSTGQDVTGGFTVVVGQPIPTMTFGLAGSGVTPPRSWVIFEDPRPGGLEGAIVESPYNGIAPGLSIIGGSNSVPAQLVGTPTQIGIFDITIQAGSGPSIEESYHYGAASDVFDYFIKVVAAPPTTFTTQPAAQTIAVGQTATFTAAAGSSPTYQWSFEGTAISGATSATLTLTNVQLSAAGFYTVAATVSGGTVTSNSATLTVLPLAAPSFTVNPVSLTIANGRSAAFSVSASGELVPTYQWNLNGVPISGVTDPVLLVSAATSANAGMSSTRSPWRSTRKVTNS